VAIAATAIVHLFNNIFKAFLIGKDADRKILLLFAVPAAFFAMFGAWLLNIFTRLDPIFSYSVAEKSMAITPVKLVIGFLMIIFALVELLPAFDRLAIKAKYIPFGGVLSGFFGGLSGHQGALRTAFLMRTNLTKKALIGTMVLAAVIVDVARLLVYGLTFFERDFQMLQQQGGFNLVVAGCICAFIGSFVGSKILDKITLKTLKIIIAVMLLLIAVALGMGLV
jgi:hypothetical protein